MDLLDEEPRQACDVKPHVQTPQPQAVAAEKDGASSQKAGTEQDAAHQPLSVTCKQPRDGSVPNMSMTTDHLSICLSEGGIQGCERTSDAPAPKSGSGNSNTVGWPEIMVSGMDSTVLSATLPSNPGMGILDNSTSSLNAAAEQLQAVCKQLLQGFNITDNLQSSIDTDAMQSTGVRQSGRSTDALAGLVSELEASLA